MADLIGQLDFWSWFILAIVLVVLEILLPTSYLLWMAIGAGVTGVIAWLAPATPWQGQWVLFAVSSVLATLAGRWFIRRHPIETDQPQLNRRGEQYVGRILTLTEAIENGRGYVNLDDTRWRAEGPDLPLGTRVKVVGVDGTCLIVERQD